MKNFELVSTGISGLDHMLHGGLIYGRSYIVSGIPGSGKTTLAMQFLLEGIKKGERCLYVTLCEPPNEIRENFIYLSPDIEKIEVFDAISDIMKYESVPTKDIALGISITPLGNIPAAIRKSPEFDKVMVTFTSLQATLKLKLSENMYDRVVIDSLTALSYFYMSGYDENSGIQSFIEFISETKITTLMLVELPFNSNHSITPEMLLCRGDIRMHTWMSKGKRKYGIVIEKYRGNRYDTKMRPFVIADKGIIVDSEQETKLEDSIEIQQTPDEPIDDNTGITENDIVGVIEGIIENMKIAKMKGLNIDQAQTEITTVLNFLRQHKFEDSVPHVIKAQKYLDHLFFSYAVSSENETADK